MRETNVINLVKEQYVIGRWPVLKDIKLWFLSPQEPELHFWLCCNIIRADNEKVYKLEIPIPFIELNQKLTFDEAVAELVITRIDEYCFGQRPIDNTISLDADKPFIPIII